MFLRALTLAGVCSVAWGTAIASPVLSENVALIRDHVVAGKPIGDKSMTRTLATANPACNDYYCCVMSAENACSISTLEPDVTSLVEPGGYSRCIYSYSTPYAFQVIPGAFDRLLIYFQGGGACWDKQSSDVGLCTSDSTPYDEVGVFNRSDINNPYREFTVVIALYCSGDTFGGDVVQSFNDRSGPTGKPVEQRGINNTHAVIDWIQQQQVDGYLSSTFTTLALGGCSAGALGVQIWSRYLLELFEYEKAVVFPDSYAAVFDDGLEGPLFQSFNFCNARFLSESIRSKCNNGTLQYEDMAKEVITTFPQVPYSAIQNYNSASNFISFFMDGGLHCITNKPEYPLADPGGRCLLDGKCSESNRTDPQLTAWMTEVLNAAIIDGSEAAEEPTVGTACYGPLANPTNATAYDSANYTSYCDEDLFPKMLYEEDNTDTDGSGISSDHNDDSDVIIIAISVIIVFLVVGTIAITAYIYYNGMKSCCRSSKMADEDSLRATEAEMSSAPVVKSKV